MTIISTILWDKVVLFHYKKKYLEISKILLDNINKISYNIKCIKYTVVRSFYAFRNGNKKY